MLSQQDLSQISKRGMTEKQVERQLDDIARGFPFLEIVAAAAVGKGIYALSDKERKEYVDEWERYVAAGHDIVKFVPASGAASRMFKNLFAYLSSNSDAPSTDFEKEFFAGFNSFAFKDALNEACVGITGKTAQALIDDGEGKMVVDLLLGKKGLNYGSLPKGLLLFHKYDDGARTPVEEHLVEAAMYASSDGKAKVHFTVSHDHLELFKKKVEEVVPNLSEKYRVSYDVSFSEQKPYTDTIAANMDNTPFRQADGSLLFRPGGHGALIENLSETHADILFIKNIDNVVPDRLKDEMVEWKKVLAGILVKTQAQAFEYLRVLDSGSYGHAKIEEIIRFVQRNLHCRKPDIKELEDGDLVIYLRNKLNRPMRVCGVVRNEGEPGGGPFICRNADGTTSLQILESSQIDKNNEAYVRMFKEGTHFNPVDLVCAIKDYKGNGFSLPNYVDANTGFISYKSKDGKELKALELPGLWNGAMSDWNTIFVEVPVSTFNPVKTVNDLLREQHSN